ncbi:hypothetical protein [Streptomyces sp. NRRL S-813]|uniref:hypothetical protein n=1 Tax=Streptomyces sp. NRRL S-813 TaxID=1463919 RepID=UPI0004BFF67C|nr:hypothetical protein [Streptomyces sp. NRRL S-813]
MSTKVQPEASMVTPAVEEQRVTAFAHAEIMIDADTGQPTFCIATEQTLGDFEAATPARGLAAAEKLREEADRIEALANEYAATVVIPAFIETYSIELEELDMAKLCEDAPDLAAKFQAFSAVKNDGSILVAVPAGQNPIARLAAIRDLVLDLRKQVKA